MLKHIKTFEGMYLDKSSNKIKDDINLDGTILVSHPDRLWKMSLKTVNTKLNGTVSITRYFYEKLSIKNINFSNVKTIEHDEDFNTLGRTNSISKNISKILYVIKNYERYKGLIVDGVKYYFTEETYFDFIENASEALIRELNKYKNQSDKIKNSNLKLLRFIYDAINRIKNDYNKIIEEYEHLINKKELLETELENAKGKYRKSIKTQIRSIEKRLPSLEIEIKKYEDQLNSYEDEISNLEINKDIDLTFDIILVPETSNILAPMIAESIKEKLPNSNDIKIYTNFFVKNQLKDIKYTEAIPFFINDTEMQNTVNTNISRTFKSMANREGGNYKSKLLSKRYGKFIYNLFRFNDDLSINDIYELLKEKRILVVDDVTTNGGATFNNIYNLLQNVPNINSVMLYSAIGRSTI